MEFRIDVQSETAAAAFKSIFTDLLDHNLYLNTRKMDSIRQAAAAELLPPLAVVLFSLRPSHTFHLI